MLCEDEVKISTEMYFSGANIYIRPYIKLKGKFTLLIDDIELVSTELVNIPVYKKRVKKHKRWYRFPFPVVINAGSRIKGDIQFDEPIKEKIVIQVNLDLRLCV